FRPTAVAADPADARRFYVLSRLAPGALLGTTVTGARAAPVYVGRNAARQPAPRRNSSSSGPGGALLYLFRFDGTALSVEPGYPVSVDAGDSGAAEMGLAAARDASGATLLAITDSARNRVLEGQVAGGAFQVGATYTAPAGTYAGPAALNHP